MVHTRIIYESDSLANYLINFTNITSYNLVTFISISVNYTRTKLSTLLISRIHIHWKALVKRIVDFVNQVPEFDSQINRFFH